jgi:glycosyltransferase involved in cell wall biosynthesis
MGAINFSLDPRLVASLQSALPLKAFVETGTYRGDTVAALASSFDKLVSIELSDSFWTNAAKRFQGYPHIQILQGASPEKLRGLRAELQSIGTLYWLDAHWCAATDTAGELSQCPLLDELSAIGNLNGDSVILIDDARLFLAPPLAPHEISHWPSFHRVVATLLSLSSGHELMVVNDVIAFFPIKAKAEMEAYARFHGVDWLSAGYALKQSEILMPQLLEKEGVIQGLVQGNQEKELLIQQQLQTIRAYQQAFGSTRGFGILLRPLARIIRRMLEIIRPRLGDLNQYAPRPLSVADQKRDNAVLASYPKISIVTPSYAQGEYIERTLLSVLDQHYPNLEYFVQDGGSTDRTAEVLEKYESRLSGWISEKDSGQSQAINNGFARTSGDIMAWLNSDDLLLPGTLNTVAGFFDRHPEVDVVYGNRLLIDENDMEIGRWIMPGHDGEVLTWVDYIPQETMFWRRRIWDKAGGRIDESFKFAMDWDMLVRFREAGAKFAHIPEFLGAFRIHRHQKTSASINEIGRQEMDRIRGRLIGKVPNYNEIRKAVFPFLMKHILVDMGYRIKTRFRSRKM